MGKLCAYAPQVVQCRQTGHDGVSPQWACEADLPEGMRFGNLEVVCEGWSRPGDTNVLAGSCALEYELEGRPEAAFGSWAHVKKREESDCEYPQSLPFNNRLSMAGIRPTHSPLWCEGRKRIAILRLE